ncbi:MAG TPA: hypothetical protein VG099_32905 [Gemmataceae bacterium]|nr:hypothetical protein [Gemmataceae bacterium]
MHLRGGTCRRQDDGNLAAWHNPIPRVKLQWFPNEGGAAIVAVDVPDNIIGLAVDQLYLPLSQGIVQFDEGAGLDELRAMWSALKKQVHLVECP